MDNNDILPFEKLDATADRIVELAKRLSVSGAPFVECFINKIKYFRRVFSRFDKLAQRYAGFLYLVSTIIWLH